MTVCFISADHDTVQQDLLLLEQWAAMWQKNFTPSKCNTVSISLKHQPSRYMYLNSLCNTPYFWWVSLFRNGRLILYCQLPQLVKADSRSTWKEATKILGVHRRNLATCGPVVKEQAYLAMSIHCLHAWSPYTQNDIRSTMISNFGWRMPDLTIFFMIKRGNSLSLCYVSKYAAPIPVLMFFI